MAAVDDIRNFHAHVYFDPATREVAERLRDAVARELSAVVGKFHSDAVGPHTKSMFQITIALDQFATVVPWLMLKRDGLSILVHPTTDDPVADHERNGFWMGGTLPLDIELLKELVRTAQGKQDQKKTNEKGSIHERQ